MLSFVFHCCSCDHSCTWFQLIPLCIYKTSSSFQIFQHKQTSTSNNTLISHSIAIDCQALQSFDHPRLIPTDSTISVNMLCKLLSLAMVALITTLALALPTDKDLITLQTDDTSKLSQLNILPILDFLDTEDSHNMSYDKCGLKLAGVHFNYTSPNLSNLTLTHTDIEAVTAWCGTSTCATANTRQWANAMQPRVIPAPACGFIAQNAKTSTVLVVSTSYLTPARIQSE